MLPGNLLSLSGAFLPTISNVFVRSTRLRADRPKEESPSFFNSGTLGAKSPMGTIHWHGATPVFMLMAVIRAQMVKAATQKTGNAEVAKELVQDVFLQVYLHKDSLQKTISPKGYLFTALKNRIFNFYRKELAQRRQDQLSHREISRLLNISTNTVEQHIKKLCSFYGLL